MSRISRLVVLVTSMAAVAGAMAGTAGAITWHVGGTGSFTATVPSVTMSATGNTIACPQGTATGTFATGSIVSPIYTISGAITFTGCSAAGTNFEWTCGYTFTAFSQPVATTMTTGDLDLTCGWFVSGTKICHIEGAAHAIYHNRAAGADTLQVTTTSTLRSTSSGFCYFGSNDLVHLNATTLSVTSNGGNGPDIVRTA